MHWGVGLRLVLEVGLGVGNHRFVHLPLALTAEDQQQRPDTENGGKADEIEHGWECYRHNQRGCIS